jgi:hypothetical protein
LLADAILGARVRAAEQDAQPLAILAAPSLPAGMAEELGEYVGEFAREVAWGVMDDCGRFSLHGPGLDSLQPSEPPSSVADSSAYRRESAPAIQDPFSDLGQWMLKVLLAPNVPERWLHAPRERVRGVADLADRARVSPASASRFLSGLAANGYVHRVEGAIRGARVEALLEAYRIAAQRPAEQRLARFLLPARDPEVRLGEVLAARQRRRVELPGSDSLEAPPDRIGPIGPIGERACLGLFSACKQLGVSAVRGAPVHLFSENLSNDFLDELELLPVEHRAEADLVVRRPRFPEAVFRACVLVKDVPVADALQCWSDVSFHPARGAEQAQEIAHLLGLKEWER